MEIPVLYGCHPRPELLFASRVYGEPEDAEVV